MKLVLSYLSGHSPASNDFIVGFDLTLCLFPRECYIIEIEPNWMLFVLPLLVLARLLSCQIRRHWGVILDPTAFLPKTRLSSSQIGRMPITGKGDAEVLILTAAKLFLPSSHFNNMSLKIYLFWLGLGLQMLGSNTSALASIWWPAINFIDPSSR